MGPLCSECGVEVKTDPHKCPKRQREFVRSVCEIDLHPIRQRAPVLQAAVPFWQDYEDHAATVAALEGRVKELEGQKDGAYTEIARLREALEKVERHAQTMHATQRDREPRWDRSYGIMAQQIERLARAALGTEAKP